MAAHFLLPCSECEKTASITVSQAGETLTCDGCQANLVVPSMSVIRKLEPDSSQPAVTKKARREWNETRGLWFSLGLVCILVGAGGVYGFMSTYQNLDVEEKYADVDQEEFEAAVDEWSVAQSWDYWKEGVEGQPLPEWKEGELSISRRFRTAMLLLASVSGAVAIFGVGSLCYSFVAKKKRKRVRRPVA